MGWQWHQLDHMQIICILLQTDNHANTSSLIFLQAECFSWCPTNSVKAWKTVMQLHKTSSAICIITSSLKWQVPLNKLSWVTFTTYVSKVCWRGVCHFVVVNRNPLSWQCSAERNEVHVCLWSRANGPIPHTLLIRHQNWLQCPSTWSLDSGGQLGGWCSGNSMFVDVFFT